MLYIRSSTGQLVPLDSVMTLRENVGPLAINHSGHGVRNTKWPF